MTKQNYSFDASISLGLPRRYQSDEFERVLAEINHKLDKENEDRVEVVDDPSTLPPHADPPESEYEHHSTGTAGDGKIISATSGSSSNWTRVGDLSELGLMGKKRSETRQDLRQNTFLKNGEDCHQKRERHHPSR